MDKRLLKNIYLFKSLEDGELGLIAQVATVKILTPGENIFKKGDEATALYIIKNGAIRIHQPLTTGPDQEITVLGNGSHFGEMAFIDNEVRSASATAKVKTDLVVLSYEKLNALLQSQTDIANRFYREMARFLSGRLRLTTNDLSFARDKNLSYF